jgi:maltokinase
MDSTLACLAAWMPRQRWYAAKGRTPALRFIGSWDVETPEPTVRVRTLLVVDEGTLPPVLYQVPVVERPTASVDADGDRVIGSPEPGTTLIDGPADPAYTGALLALVAHGGRGDGARTAAIGRPAASAPSLAAEHVARVLTGEQSNTSIIYAPGAAGAPVICKVFRQLHAGLNPDIELQTALADEGSPYVPRAVGALEGEWPDPRTGTGTVHGSLAFAQEFLPGVEDAWRVALRAAAADEDFAAPAAALGAATADVHRDLARLFPTRDAGSDDRARLTGAWHERLATAVAEVPALAAWRDAVAAVYDRAAHAPWPMLQRVHGDYHLGQVILVPDRGWVLLDFEGEPLRPMTERVRPDLALRDVAGMLRSFDYVAGSIRLDQPERSAETVRAWAARARAAFLDGYGAGDGPDVLRDALELDKAVYEAIYEARNRPTWVAIPLRAIERLAQSA